MISDFFTHSFTFATCLRHFHHQFSAVFRQKKLLLKDGGGRMGWKEIGCLFIKSCHQKPCHHKTNRNSAILLNYITRKLGERHFRGSQEANCLPRTLPHPPRVIKTENIPSWAQWKLQCKASLQIRLPLIGRLYLQEQTPPSSDDGQWPRSSPSWLTGKFDHND